MWVHIYSFQGETKNLIPPKALRISTFLGSLLSSCCRFVHIQLVENNINYRTQTNPEQGYNQSELEGKYMVKQTNQMFASQCCRQGCSLHQHYAKAYSNSSTTRLMRVEMCIIQMAQFHISPKQRHTLRRTKNHCFIINIPDIYSNRMVVVSVCIF